ncbi:MBG domain-containing protein [Mitsuaria sp. BK037]|uniref:two-partner secretion domain-containing protein n=1 Tax=Mitsuaria sp. BK037 TaxID=2587122 RepID=UPI0016189993|nr:MBG domain-containing protein [Mitsuaria sp. BK037]
MTRLLPTPSSFPALPALPAGSRRAPVRRPRLTALTAAMLAGLLPLTGGAQTAASPTLPRNGSVSAGQAVIGAPAGHRLDILQQSQRAVLRWDSFSVGAGSAVEFKLPNAQAATLNVVTGPLGSEIAGSLKSNGSLFLINPQGIAITPSGVVDTRAGFVASTLGLSDEDFMAGRLRFNGRGGTVLNQGLITAGGGGQVALLGSHVQNDGVILAPLGKVALGSASVATLDFSGDGFLQVILPADAVDGDSRPLVQSSGRIAAGLVALRAATVREALREAIHLPGEIRATTLSGSDGAIVLDGGAGGTVRVSGRVDASSADAAGGRIDITGQRVELAGAALDASGATRGGLVRVGGAFQGGKASGAQADGHERFLDRFGPLPALASAEQVSVDAGSRIDVSARGPQGLGGTAVLWSERATRMLGRLDASGASSGGAVEISSASTVQSVALNRLTLGAGARLLLDPQDIVIGDGASVTPPGDIGYGDAPGTATTLNSADLAALLGSGVSVRLQASQDISWSTFFTGITRGAAPVGDLMLAAGRTITLSGVFSNGGGHWTLTANDTAAHGVIDAERGAGPASLDLSGARFINDNGPLTLLLADGAGNTERTAGALRIGAFAGQSLTATVMTTATTGGGSPAELILQGDVSVAGAATLSGPIRVSGASEVAGGSVTWTTEGSDTILGEGGFRFVENGIVTRLARLGGVDATRVALGNDTGTAVTRVYGDAEPDADHLGRAPVHVVRGTPASVDGLFAAGSLSVTGPGVAAPAGSGTLTLSATGSAAIDAAAVGNFFVDLSAATMPLTITRRALTPTVSNGSYVYGSPGAVVSLAGVVNGDNVAPIATLGAQGGVAMGANGAGYGFADRVGAGSWNFTLTGLGGSAASNYTLDLSGMVSAQLSIAKKPLDYFVGNGSQTYGSTHTMPTAFIGGMLAGDDVTPVVGLSSGGTPVAVNDRLAAGSYVASVTSLGGASASNYSVGTINNHDGVYRVDPKLLTWSVGAGGGVYGTLGSLGGATLSGVLAGDVVNGTVSPSADGGSTVFAPAATTRAGTYTAIVSALTGADAGNYALATSGNTPGQFVVAPKPVTYTGTTVDQVYGLALPSPVLNGVLAGDVVAGFQKVDALRVDAGSGHSQAWPVGQYATTLLWLTGADAGNYVIAGSGNTATTVNVLPKALTYVAATGSNVYGTPQSGAMPALSGVVAGDQVTAAPAIESGGNLWLLDAGSRAGTYTSTVVAGSLSGAGAGNYTIAAAGNTNGTWTVTPKPITWSVAAGSAIYGNAPTASTNVTVLDGLLPGASVSPALTALDGNGAPVARPTVGGTWWAGVAGLSGPDAANYLLAGSGNTAGALTVTPRPVTFSVANASSVYGNLATTGAVTLNNVLAGDSVGYTAAILAGSTPVTLSARTGAGAYTETVTALTGNPNYLLASAGNAPGTLTVQPRPISYIAQDASSTYGTAATPGAVTVQGVLAGDSVGAGPAVLLASGVAPAERTAAGSWTLGLRSLTGADAANYVPTETGSTTGTLIVAPKPVTVTVQGYFTMFGGFHDSFMDRALTYGTGDTPRASGSINGLLAGDQVAVTTATTPITRSRTGRLNVGTYTFSATGLEGADAGNYVMAAAGNRFATLRITPAVVANAAWVQGTDHTDVSPTYGSAANYTLRTELLNAFAGDDVALGAWADLPGGRSTTLPARLTPGTYGVDSELLGADKGNYVMLRASTSTFRVVPKLLTAVIDNTASTYGDALPATGGNLYGVLAGDTVSVTTAIAGVPASNGRMPAGQYGIHATGLAGAEAGNYALSPENFGAPGLPLSRSGQLTVLPRSLQRAMDPGSLSITYGDTLPQLRLTGGVLPGDEVFMTNVVVPTQVQGLPVLDGRDTALSTSLAVGTYRYVPRLSGRDAANYVSGGDAGTVTIAPKPVTVTIDPISTVYGSYVAPSVSVWGLVNGEQNWVKPNFDVVGASGFLTYNDRSNAGSYTQQVTGLHLENGFSGMPDYTKNYVFVSTPGASAPLTIARKPLTFTPAASTTAVYGDALTLGALSGVLPGDDVGVRLEAGDGFQSQQLLNGNGTLNYATRVDAGDHLWSASLTGSRRGNYVVDPIGGRVSIARRDVIYGIKDAEGVYGNYTRACTPSGCTPLPYLPGATTFQGVLSGDTLGGNVAFTDLTGQLITIDGSTHAGTYFQVLTGLTGDSAKNYRIADSGSRPGLYKILPMPLSYTVSSGVFLGQLYGTPGEATLSDLQGPITGRLDIAPIVTAYDPKGRPVSDLSQLTVGRYTFRVTGLTGADTHDYRVGDGPAGTLDVFASSSLGLGLVEPLPTPPVIPTVAPVASPALPVAPPLNGQFRSSGSGQEEDFGRNIDATGIVGGVALGPTGGGVSGRASGVVEGSVDLGGADLSAQASGEIAGLAKFGITGVRLEASADAHVDVTITSGPGYVMFGAQGDAYAIGSLGRNGLRIGAEARAGVSAQAGASGHVDGLGDAHADTTVSTFVYARADEQYMLRDGQVVQRFDNAVGVGSSAGVSAGVSGSTGSVGGGATVYTPGSIGGTFNYSVGLSDGAISVSLDLGAQLGFGGLGLSLNFSIDPMGLAGAIANSPVGDLVINAFGMNHREPDNHYSEADSRHAASIGDPVERYNYLAGNTRWRDRPWNYDSNPDARTDWDNMQNFFNTYNQLLSRTQTLIKKEQTDQARFLDLLKTDPKAAIEMSHSGNFVQANRDEESALQGLSRQLGVQLAVVDGQVTYVAGGGR